MHVFNLKTPDVAANDIIRRMIYVQSEFDTNGEAVQAAIGGAELGGADKNNTKVWWDKK